MTTTPDTDELETRARLNQLGVSYAPTPPSGTATAPEHAPDAALGEEPHLEDAPPAAESTLAAREAPLVRTVPARATASRLPDWRLPKAELPAHEEEPADAEEEAPAEDQEPGEDASPRRGRLTLVKEAVVSRAGRPAAQEPQEEDAGDTEEAEEDTDDAEEPEAEDGAEPAGKRWRGARRAPRAPRPRRRPRLAAHGVPFTMRARDRRSLLEVIRSVPDHVVWMLYTGSALGAGFYVGAPQWVMHGTAVLAAQHPSLTDGYSFQCYALAAAVFVLDWRGRRWVLPLAWAARGLSASLVVGVLLDGVQTPISQLF
ncbi:hypothetical protein [Streptomyces fuscigenes]|uniref:hypothetical protein n=1 Tax=Streptomyces fuscigenes TaxID=1528880 RepID=UPI001F38CBFE|nr:hypothetical protein [Streptomyces fuscigenes]MCF3960305.1 hypothetical protein [Streptomyces fuscigenes]